MLKLTAKTVMLAADVPIKMTGGVLTINGFYYSSRKMSVRVDQLFVINGSGRLKAVQAAQTFVVSCEKGFHIVGAHESIRPVVKYRRIETGGSCNGLHSAPELLYACWGLYDSTVENIDKTIDWCKRVKAAYVTLETLEPGRLLKELSARAMPRYVCLYSVYYIIELTHYLVTWPAAIGFVYAD